MAKILLLLSGLIFIAVGGVNIASPQSGVAPLGLELVTIDSLNEIRANYGGMHLLLGLFMLAAALKDNLRKPGLLVLAVFTGGLVLGRLVSLVMDGMPGNMMLGFLVIEAIGCVMATFIITRETQSDMT